MDRRYLEFTWIQGISLHQAGYATGHTIYNDLVARTLGNYQGTFNYIDWQNVHGLLPIPKRIFPKVYFADQVTAPNGKQNYTRANNAGTVLNSNNSRFLKKEITWLCVKSRSPMRYQNHNIGY